MGYDNLHDPDPENTLCLFECRSHIDLCVTRIFLMSVSVGPFQSIPLSSVIQLMRHDTLDSKFCSERKGHQIVFICCIDVMNMTFLY